MCICMFVCSPGFIEKSAATILTCCRSVAKHFVTESGSSGSAAAADDLDGRSEMQAETQASLKVFVLACGGIIREMERAILATCGKIFHVILGEMLNTSMKVDAHDACLTSLLEMINCIREAVVPLFEDKVVMVCISDEGDGIGPLLTPLAAASWFEMLHDIAHSSCTACQVSGYHGKLADMTVDGFGSSMSPLLQDGNEELKSAVSKFCVAFTRFLDREALPQGKHTAIMKATSTHADKVCMLLQSVFLKAVENTYCNVRQAFFDSLVVAEPIVNKWITDGHANSHSFLGVLVPDLANQEPLRLNPSSAESLIVEHVARDVAGWCLREPLFR